MIFKLSAECQNYILTFTLITENDFIDHNNKDNPIVPYYQKNNYIAAKNQEKNLEFNYQ